MISAWHEDCLGASEPIVRFDATDSQYTNAPSTNHVTLLGIRSI